MNSFFRAVTTITASCFAILRVSLSVVEGSGVFCMRVMRKTVSKIWLLKGGWSASARRSATFLNFLACPLASLRMRGEISIPTSSLTEFPICLIRSPVPHPTSSTLLLGFRCTSPNAASIFASCSSAYCASYVLASLS